MVPKADDWLPTGRTVYAYLPQLGQSRILSSVALGWTGERGRTPAVRGTCDGRQYTVPLALVAGRETQLELARLMEASCGDH